MRTLILLAALGLAGCGNSPASLGITGPGAPPSPAPASDDSTITSPGVPDQGGGYLWAQHRPDAVQRAVLQLQLGQWFRIRPIAR